jgi:hypothetical protein
MFLPPPKKTHSQPKKNIQQLMAKAGYLANSVVRADVLEHKMKIAFSKTEYGQRETGKSSLYEKRP